jgi:acid stress chaperone HdeB
MKSRVLLSTPIAIIVGIASVSLARTQDLIDLSRITCEDFIFYKTSNPNAIAHWLSGYYHGKINDPVVHPQALEKNVERVRGFCTEAKNYKTTLMKVIELQNAPPR